MLQTVRYQPETPDMNGLGDRTRGSRWVRGPRHFLKCLIDGVRPGLPVFLLAGPAAIAAAGSPDPMAHVTVEAHTLEQKARSFVMNLTAASGFALDGNVQQWRQPICPMIAGLPRKEGQAVFDRIDDVLTASGAPRGKVGCHPNFFVIVTNEPESVLRGAWQRNWHLFGDASLADVKQFIRTQRPVRVWYNTILTGQDGGSATTAQGVPALASDLNLNGSAFAQVPAVASGDDGVRARFQALNDLLAVVAIVDPTELQGFNWTQVADYIAMAGLTRVAPDVDLGGTPSILGLFTVAAGSRPPGLSDWDRTFLKGLYSTDPTWRDQRFQVSHLMARDLQSASR
jgi:hypothetical protein